MKGKQNSWSQVDSKSCPLARCAGGNSTETQAEPSVGGTTGHRAGLVVSGALSVSAVLKDRLFFYLYPDPNPPK